MKDPKNYTSEADWLNDLFANDPPLNTFNTIIWDGWEWGCCGLCKKPFVICPICGNNTCGGGSGIVLIDGKSVKCSNCMAAHDEADKKYDTDNQPPKEIFTVIK